MKQLSCDRKVRWGNVDESPPEVDDHEFKIKQVEWFSPATLNFTGAGRWRVVSNQDCGLSIKIDEARERGNGVDKQVGRGIMMDHGT